MTDSESLLNEALDSEWPIPGYDRQRILPGCNNRLDSPALFRIFLDGAFSRNQITTDKATIPQLSQLADVLLIGSKPLNRIYCVDLFYEQISKHSYLDADVMKLLYSLRPAIIRSVLLNNFFLIKPKHPLRKALEDICSWGIGWDKTLGKSAERYFDLLKNIAEMAANLDDQTQSLHDEYASCINGLTELAQRHKQIEERVCQLEHASMESLKIRRKIESVINSAIENKLLPVPGIRFFHSAWRDVLYRTLAVSGEKSAEWQSADQLMKKIVFCLSADTDKDNRQVRLEMIPTLYAPLKKVLFDSGENDPNAHWFDELDALLKLTLVGEKIAVEPAPVLSSVEVDGVTTSISSTISQRVAQLEPGQWLLYRDEKGESARARLAVSSPDAGQMLFVNLLGAKPLSKSMEELGYALTTKRAHLLVSKNLPDILLSLALDIFTAHYKKYSTNQKKSPGNANNTALEHRKNSAEKALAEAKKLQSSQLAETAVSNANTTPALSGEERPAIEATVASLEIGSWISIKNRLGEQTPSKIAVVYASTGKMVLVDRSGLRVGEFLRQELVQLIMNGEANILEQGDTFEASLSRVLQTLRKKT